MDTKETNTFLVNRILYHDVNTKEGNGGRGGNRPVQQSVRSGCNFFGVDIRAGSTLHFFFFCFSQNSTTGCNRINGQQRFLFFVHRSPSCSVFFLLFFFFFKMHSEIPWM